jgi:hypothetical protein
MADIIRPGQGFLYMKVGTHAQESLEDIIARKTQEIEDAGFAMWGYGGNTCHPAKKVQPFARACAVTGSPIYLCMEKMDSKHFAEPVAADEWSADGINWQPVPAGIEVRGSRYALVINSLRAEEFDLSLRNTRVAMGDCMGQAGSRYIKGRVDKACLELAEPHLAVPEDRIVRINLVAELADPYAVYVRNKPSGS